MPFVDALNNGGRRIIFEHLVSGTTVDFPAFLTQFEDQYTSEWNEENAFGRMDPISTFKRTGRKISLGWDVPARSEAEAVEMLGRISSLIRMLYPSYHVGGHSHAGTYMPSSTHISGPPLLKVQFVNLIQDPISSTGLLGYVNGFTTSPVLESGFSEHIGEGRGLSLYPKAYKLSCTFTVLHTRPVGWVAGGATDRSVAGEASPRSFSSAAYPQNFPYGTMSPYQERSGLSTKTGGLEVGNEVQDLDEGAATLTLLGEQAS